MKDPRVKYTLALTVLLLAGLGAFVIGRYAISEDSPAIAQVGPDETPQPRETPEIIYLASPHPDVLAMETAIAEDNAKPLFTGTINGITFIGEGTPSPQAEDGDACDNDELKQVQGDEARLVARDSGLNLEVTDLPSGLELISETATLCGDVAIRTAQIYSDNADGNARRLAIGMSKKPPIYPALAPEDRLEALTIGRREAVLVKSIFGLDSIRIIMHDEDARWTIIANHIDEDDVIEIAEGVE